MKEFSKKGKTKDITVKSLDEYVKVLAGYPSKSFFFRGENGFYREREASAFRESKEGGKFQDFLSVVNDFYSEIAYRLGDVEKAHFLAFSQHHGIPTNLIDVSTSPLFALYFACYGKESEGYVYMFDDEFIDITSIMVNNPKENFVSLILENDEIAIAEFCNKMCRFEENHQTRFFELFDCLISDIKHLIGKPLFGTDVTKLKQYKRKRINDDEWRFHNIEIAMKIGQEENLQIKYNARCDFNSMAPTYTTLVVYLLKKLHEYTEYVYWLNGLPSMIYKPDILFERARLQRGFFIVQAFMHHTEPMYEVDVLARQRVVYRQRVKISSASKVLQELNNIGVNRASIFGDFDNIAMHMVGKSRMVTQ